MNISQIVEQVQALYPNANEESVLQALIDAGIEASDVSKGEIPAIARRVANSQGGTLVKPTVQPTTSDRALSRPVQPNQPKANGLSTRVNKRGAALDKKVTANNDDRRGADNSLVTFARGVDQKIADHSEQATAAITGIAVHRANEVVSALKEAPKVYFQTIQEGLEDGIDHDSFREASAEFEQQLLEHFPWLGETA